ncbi:chondroitin sulfate proteoglycan 4-like [Polyodon spathula]|uniref:chondroitin sulfate proteoglycan 4-like n=1 Tax=Polyodon spathula TaxID=7913 RepID=UPI001B7E41A9|nr:chondroitin sulfate proteoglycan 4-like [Polyodon spathula]
METKGELAVYPGTSKPITSQILKTVTNGMREEALSEEITYHVLRAPHLGRLISANQTMVSSFTQAGLETGSIWYQQELPKKAFWISQDSIDFLLSAPLASELEHTLPVSISFLEQNPTNSSQLWKNTGQILLENMVLLMCQNTC